MRNGHTCGGEFGIAHAARTKTSDVRRKSRTIQRLRDLGHLALAAPEIQLAGQQQHRPSHEVLIYFSADSAPWRFGLVAARFYS
jgi:cysteine sulfinate desulfinase/cysteine desulfurase-like protein